MRLALLILLALFSTSASAEPATIAAISAFVVAYGQVILTVGMMIYGAAQQARAEKDAQRAADQERANYNANLQDRTITNIAVENPYTYAYGRVRVGSSIVGIFSSGDNDEYKHLVCIHAAHECDSIEEVYINGVALGPLDSGGGVTGGQYLKITTENSYGGGNPVAATYTLPLNYLPETISVLSEQNQPDDGSGGGGGFQAFAYSVAGNVLTVVPASAYGTSYSVYCQYVLATPMIRVQKHLGTDIDPADAFLMSQVPTQWKSTAVLRGFCYTVVTLNLHQADFQSGVPNVEVVLRGRKLYDFRTATTAWSQNPVLATYDYLTSELCGVAVSDLPMSKFIAAANVCDEVFDFGNRYTLNGTCTSDQAQAQILEQFAQSMAGTIVATNWVIRAGKYIAPVMALQQTDIVGPIAVTPGMSDTATYNGVKGQYISPINDYVLTDYVPYQNAALVTLDGAEMWTNINLPYTDDLQRVQNLCRIFTEKNRNAYTVKADFSLKAWALQVGDRVTLNSPYFGWTNKIFEITDKIYSPTSAVNLTLKEDAEGIWDFADEVTADSTPNTDLPNPFVVGMIASLSCESGTDVLQISQTGEIISRILVTWPQLTQITSTNGTIEVQWQQTGDTNWGSISVPGNSTQAYISPVIDRAFYTVRARAVDNYYNVKSDWTYATLHQVIGKSEPPGNVMGLSINGTVLSWDSVTDLDLKGYIFRFHYGSNLDWNSATPLNTGFITQSPYDMITRPAGQVTIMGKAVDTSNNESLATANIFTDLGDILIANVIKTIDFDAAGYPASSLTGATLVGGNLVATALDSFYGTDDQSAYNSDSLPFYETGAYSQMVYTTNYIPIDGTLLGSLMTLVLTTQGTDLVVEYRGVDGTPFYDMDEGATFYGPDSEPFYPGNQPPWQHWPGQIAATDNVYQFRVTIGAGTTQGIISYMALVIDAPDMVEHVNNLLINSGGTVVPHTMNFTSIENVQVTLQANLSGATTVQVNKTTNLSPIITAYNSAGASVSGATVDITLKGY